MKYREQYELLHKKRRYGTSSERMVADIYNTIIKYYPNRYNSLPSSIIDYGCGQSNTLDLVADKLSIPKDKRYRYDFAIDKYSTLPSKKYSVGICTDVLEHIPEEELDEVLGNLKKYSKMWYITICGTKAISKLPNGENCHCTVKSKDWWIDKIKEYFTGVINNGGTDTNIKLVIY